MNDFLMNDFLMYSFWQSLGGVSGGIIYIMSKDVYNIYIVGNQRKSSDINLKNIFNPGLYFGIGLGALRVYLGKPVLEYYLSKK